MPGAQGSPRRRKPRATSEERQGGGRSGSVGGDGASGRERDGAGGGDVAGPPLPRRVDASAVIAAARRGDDPFRSSKPRWMREEDQDRTAGGSGGGSARGGKSLRWLYTLRRAVLIVAGILAGVIVVTYVASLRAPEAIGTAGAHGSSSDTRHSGSRGHVEDNPPVTAVEQPTKLMRAAYMGQLTAVQRLLDDAATAAASADGAAHAGDSGTGVNVNALLGEQTALHLALAGRHAQLSDVGVGGRNRDGAPAGVLTGDHEAVVERLLAVPGIATGASALCPLRDAVHYRAIAPIRSLTKAMPDAALRECLGEQDYYGRTPLHVAARSKATGFARLFVARQLRRQLDGGATGGGTAAAQKARRAYDKRVLSLLGFSHDPDHSDLQAAINAAAGYGTTGRTGGGGSGSAVAGAGAGAVGGAGTALDHLGREHSLVSHDRMDAAASVEDLHTVLTAGIRAGMGRAWMDMEDREGLTALLAACTTGRDAAAVLLVKQMAATAKEPLEVAAATKAGPLGMTCAHVAAANGHAAVLTAWAQFGSSPDVPDALGRTALMVAALQGMRPASRALLLAGADPHARDALGHDVASYARDGGDHTLAAWLEGQPRGAERGDGAVGAPSDGVTDAAARAAEAAQALLQLPPLTPLVSPRAFALRDVVLPAAKAGAASASHKAEDGGVPRVVAQEAAALVTALTRLGKGTGGWRGVSKETAEFVARSLASAFGTQDAVRLFVDQADAVAAHLGVTGTPGGGRDDGGGGGGGDSAVWRGVPVVNATAADFTRDGFVEAYASLSRPAILRDASVAVGTRESGTSGDGGAAADTARAGDRTMWAARSRWTRRRILRDRASAPLSVGLIPYAQLYSASTPDASDASGGGGAQDKEVRLADFVEAEMPAAGKGKGKDGAGRAKGGGVAWVDAVIAAAGASGGDGGGGGGGAASGVGDTGGVGAAAMTSAHPPRYTFDAHVLHADAGLASDAPLASVFDYGLDPVLRQFALGPALTGAPMHFHGRAFNALVHGVKLWVLLPPPLAIFSTRHPVLWLLHELPVLARRLSSSHSQRGKQPSDQRGGSGAPGDAWGDDHAAVYVTVQGPGDVVFVPENWAHVVVNLADCVGVAYEYAVLPHGSAA